MSKVSPEFIILIMLGFIFIMGACAIAKLAEQRMTLINMTREYDKKEEEIENLRLYTEMLENKVVESRKFRHDSKNLMAAIMGYIDSEDYKGLQEFYKNEILQELHNLDTADDISYMNYIKNPALKGLVLSKMLQAQKQGLQFKINLLQDVEDMHMKNVDFCRITGILLDNAIEAAILSNEKIVNFGIIEDSEEIYVIVSNSYVEKPEISQIYTEGYSTKGNNRGMGLNILKSIINNYSNVLSNTLIKDNVFMQEIIIEKEMN